MRLLLDTHLLLWAALRPTALSPQAVKLMGDSGNELSFSVVTIWEVVIKLGRGRADFEIDPVVFRDNLRRGGYHEIGVVAEHVLAVRDLPPIHGDPFDRLLLAQARIENLTLLTADGLLARYPGPVLKV
ncbi:twitching motility protein PilT [Aureimonas endophytica]|uniref:Twitching motility protein PilT n=1 Tax=Aureimonas endophytica TaxID=2027858 RepID=A0A916ZYL6_9HYPH|nr:type II toxin-antitoxin system VapC family toxin [Aureimonas endophytica]GGE18690.1 twitching motility protein PilT [Aureimonas endophytica]